MGRLLTLGILGTLAGKEIVPGARRVPGVRPLRVLMLVLFAANADAQTGSITGLVTTTAKGAPPMRVTFDQKVCGDELPNEATVVDAQGGLANAVVTLTGLKRGAAADVLVMNEKCRFAPRVQVVRPNAIVKTTSKDAVLHTTQALLESGKTIFNVALPVPGITITKPIGAAGPVRLHCNTHPWMRGWVIVTDEAAAVSSADGRFTIDNVPPGTYELRVWHETLKGAPQKVTVVAGRPTEANFQVK